MRSNRILKSFGGQSVFQLDLLAVSSRLAAMDSLSMLRESWPFSPAALARALLNEEFPVISQIAPAFPWRPSPSSR